MKALKVYLFGGFRLEWDGQPLRELPTHKARSLLAYLVWHPHCPHSRAYLATLFWPETDEPKAKHNLRQALYSIRKLLSTAGPRHQLGLEITANSVCLHLQKDVWVDAHEIARRASLALQTRSLEKLEQAAQLYRGEFLAGTYDDWCLRERERLKELYLDVLRALMDLHIRQRKFKEALPYAKRLLLEKPLQEELHRRVMRLHYETGDLDAAVRQYRECEQAWREELGVDPSEKTRTLYEQILKGELLPSLRASPRMVTEVTTMKVAPVKEFKAHATQYLRGKEPVLITRRGKLAGFFVPVDDPASLPWDLRRELLAALTAQLRQKAEEKG